MISDRFEWDDAKAAANFEKHGVPFALAMRVFESFGALDVVDGRRDYGEVRRNVIGAVEGGVVLLVSYTMREERIRIISARRAVRHELKGYDERRKRETSGDVGG